MRWSSARILGQMVLVFLSVACDLIESQKPAEIFHDKDERPEPLKAWANPRPSQGIADLHFAKDPHGRLTVAVIDNGTDYLHPWLSKQIAFTAAENEIVGAGFDVLGADAWAHPNLINGNLYAFGADGIEDGKIKGPSNDPLAELEKFNSEFMSGLVRRSR